MNAPAPAPNTAPTAPTPASVAAPTAPTAPTTSDTKPAPSSPTDSFDNLGSADDLDASIELPADSTAAPATETEGATSTTEAPGQPPKEPPAATASPQPAPAQEPPKEPSKDGAAAPAPSPAPSAADNSPQGLVEQLERNREAVLSALAGDRFKLSEAEVKALDTDAVGAIPSIMARTYYETMQSTLLHIQNLVPQMVHQVLRAQKQSDEVENSFYGQFKALDRSKHANDVATLARMMRQANPQISQQDLFAMVGAAVMAKHGLAAAPVVNGGGAPRPSQPAPFVPAQAGASVRVTPEPEGPFMGLGRDFDE